MAAKKRPQNQPAATTDEEALAAKAAADSEASAKADEEAKAAAKADEEAKVAAKADEEAKVAAKADEEAKVAKETKGKRPPKEVEALFVRTKRQASRRRAGFTFTAAPFGIALDALTDEQLAAIESDPMLHVERSTMSPE
jgi:hypothetical protein